MRSCWKLKTYIRTGYSSINDSGGKLFVRRGFLNPLFYDKRILIYRGNIFKNFKVREEMVSIPIQSFVISRPPFYSIRAKFGGVKGAVSKKKRT